MLEPDGKLAVVSQGNAARGIRNEGSVCKLALASVQSTLKKGLWELLGLDGKAIPGLNQTYVLQRPWVM